MSGEEEAKTKKKKKKKRVAGIEQLGRLRRFRFAERLRWVRASARASRLRNCAAVTESNPEEREWLENRVEPSPGRLRSPQRRGTCGFDCYPRPAHSAAGDDLGTTFEGGLKRRDCGPYRLLRRDRHPACRRCGSCSQTLPALLLTDPDGLIAARLPAAWLPESVSGPSIQLTIDGVTGGAAPRPSRRAVRRARPRPAARARQAGAGRRSVMYVDPCPT